MAYTTIDDPSAYFQTALYTGNGGTQVITNDGNSDLQPDWVWDKNRTTSGYHHNLYDSTRGTGKQLRSNTNDAEITQAQGLTAFNSDGFSLGTDDSSNKTSSEYVAWQWKANGGTTSSNSDGSITSTVQANTTAGFSIVTYTGTGSAATIGHGLSSEVAMLIVKKRDAGSHDGHWTVWHKGLSSPQHDEVLFLNLTNAEGDVSNDTYWNGANPTSSVFSVNTNENLNENTSGHVAYCFAEKKGYSKFGSYTGNGNADGPMVFCGFKPAWVMIKRTDASAEWHIWDNKREDYNGNSNDTALRANNNNAESDSTDYSIDFLSNGFKLRNASNLDNASSSTQIFMAFAESPFVSSEGVPTTAR